MDDLLRWAARPRRRSLEIEVRRVSEGLYERIYEVTRRIPRGRVATYGQIARLVGMPKAARQVGYAMAALGRGAPRPDVPWHRVVNAKGESSIGGEQIERLRAEGVVFDALGRIDLRRFGWQEVGLLDEGSLFG